VLAEALLDRFFWFHLGAQLRTCAFLRQMLPLDAPEEVQVEA
jgi:hypothetical protein